jgi:hypothetical protein
MGGRGWEECSGWSDNEHPFFMVDWNMDVFGLITIISKKRRPRFKHRDNSMQFAEISTPEGPVAFFLMAKPLVFGEMNSFDRFTLFFWFPCIWVPV